MCAGGGLTVDGNNERVHRRDEEGGKVGGSALPCTPRARRGNPSLVTRTSNMYLSKIPGAIRPSFEDRQDKKALTAETQRTPRKLPESAIDALCAPRISPRPR